MVENDPSFQEVVEEEEKEEEEVDNDERRGFRGGERVKRSIWLMSGGAGDERDKRKEEEGKRLRLW